MPFEYRSERVVGDLPLVHISVGGRDENGRYRVGLARGIVALGDLAFGLIAVGGVAFGVVSVGGLAFGLVAMAGVAVALAAVGGVAIGVVAVGAVAIGVWAIGAATPWSASGSAVGLIKVDQLREGARPRVPVGPADPRRRSDLRCDDPWASSNRTNMRDDDEPTG
jgi:hypothetical protein